MPEALAAQFGPLAYVIQLLLAIVVAMLAQQRGRRPLLWFVIGVFFGVLCLPVLAFIPDLERERMLRRMQWMEEQLAKPLETVEPAASAQATSPTAESSTSPSADSTVNPAVDSQITAKSNDALAALGWYFVVSGGDPEGPLTLRSLRARAHELGNKLAMVWHPDLDAWTPIEKVAFLKG